MKGEIFIILFVTLAVALTSFFIFIAPWINFTGFVVNNPDNSSVVYFRSDALLAINSSELFLLEMVENNFSTGLMNDTLTEAKRVLQQVDYADILRNPNSSFFEQTEARKYLSLIKWENLNYSLVIQYTDLIEERRNLAFELYDSLNAFEILLERTESLGVTTLSSREIFDEARNSFYSDRYEESSEFLDNARKELESLKVQNSFSSGIKRGAMNFIQQNLIQILIFLLVILLLTYLTYKKISKKSLKNKILLKENQLKVLNDLIKKIQYERFQENKISELVYNIRIKSYKEQIEKIKRELPVLKSNFNRLYKR